MIGILIISVVSVIISVITLIVGFVLGVKVSKKVEDIKPLEMPKKKIKLTREEQREANKEQEYYETVLNNIEKYDGTGLGQEEV